MRKRGKRGKDVDEEGEEEGEGDEEGVEDDDRFGSQQEAGYAGLYVLATFGIICGRLLTLDNGQCW